MRDLCPLGRWGAARDRGLSTLAGVAATSAGLADQVIRAVLADRAARRRVRVRWAVSAALAAGVLLAVTLRFLPSPRPQTPGPDLAETPGSQVSVKIDPHPPESPKEESSVQAATDVLVAMLDRARKETDNQVTMLRPVVAPPVFDEPPHAIDKTEGPLAEAGQGVVHGFEPVSGSARRAVGLIPARPARNL